MSLLTCCPSCGTQFRVVSDQLRISDGWVRCGRCQEVFDASQSLQEYHEPEPAPLLTRPPAPAGHVSPAAPQPPEPLQPPPSPTTAVPPPAQRAATSVASASPAQLSMATVFVPPGTAELPPPPPVPEVVPAPRPEPGWTEQTDVGYELPTPKEPVLDADPVWTAVPAAVGTEPAFDPEARAPLPATPAPSAQADSVAEPVLAEESSATTVRPAPKDEPDWVAALEFPEPAPVPDLPSLLSQQRSTEAGQAAPADPLDAALAPPPEVAASSGSSSVDDDLPAAAAAAAAAAATTRAPTVSTPVVEAAHAHDDEDDNDTAAQARAGDDGAATPSFVRQAQRQARWRKPWVRAILAAAAVVLPLLLLGQVALHERNALAASAPAVRPALTALCQVLGCSIEPPRDITMVVIAGTSFTEDGRPGRYRLGVSVRNQARTPVATPALELTLTDASDQPLARRVFLPQELSAPQALGPRAEWNGSFPVQVQELPQPVVGYRAQLFYP